MKLNIVSQKIFTYDETKFPGKFLVHSHLSRAYPISLQKWDKIRRAWISDTKLRILENNDQLTREGNDLCISYFGRIVGYALYTFRLSDRWKPH